MSASANAKTKCRTPKRPPRRQWLVVQRVLSDGQTVALVLDEERHWAVPLLTG
jgi:hypothetical protein